MAQYFLVLVLFLSAAHLRADEQFGSDWVVTIPHADRIFLSHQSTKKFVLLTKFRTSKAASKFEEYFAGAFSGDAYKSRREILLNEHDAWSELETGSGTHKGVRFGATSARVQFGRVSAAFFERVWINEKTLWHLSFVSLERNSGGEIHLDMDRIMEKINVPASASMWKSLLPFAYAQADERCETALPGSISELDSIVPHLLNESNFEGCRKLNIHPSRLGTKYGVKIHKAGYVSCLDGAGDALKSMKQGFLSTLDEWSEETEKKVKGLRCHEPIPGKGLFASIAYAQLMDAYQKCLMSAGTGAAISIMTESLKQTSGSLKALYRWVKTEEDPIGVITSILASKYESFMCLGPDAQLNAVCEFATHFISGAVGTAIGSAGAALAIKNGVTAVRTLASLPHTKSPLKVTVTRSPGETRALAEANRKVNGVSAAFKNADPFVKSVAEGRAEAARIALALKEGAILTKSSHEIDTMLKSRGFTRIDTCIKLEGKCVKHINPKTGKEEIAPMVVYIHPSGLAARLKPHGQSNAKFRPEPHGSFMLVNPETSDLPRALIRLKTNNGESEKFMNEYLSWERELAKVDMSTGTPLPSAPARTRVPEGLSEGEINKYHDIISDLTHFPMR